MSYIGGGMYDAKPCPECGAILCNCRCENPDCIYHWQPRAEDEPCSEEDVEDES